jgi:T-complex protein 1 subunit eta
MSHMMQPQIVLLREGTDTSQGIGQLVSNINACQAVAEVIRTTLGPCGMDKLIHADGKSTISNDGAELMNLLDIVHPAAKTLSDIAQAQDVQVGDGTTTVVLLAAQFLKNAKQFVEDGMHPMIIVRGYRNAMHFALKAVKRLATKIDECASSCAWVWVGGWVGGWWMAGWWWLGHYYCPCCPRLRISSSSSWSSPPPFYCVRV